MFLVDNKTCHKLTSWNEEMVVVEKYVLFQKYLKVGDVDNEELHAITDEITPPWFIPDYSDFM